MCGLLAIVRPAGHALALTDAAAERMRDIMTHRGPDAAGLWRTDHALLAHRRLAVIDPSPAGAQPMLSPDESLALVYNGMLYNDPAVRARLACDHVGFRTSCDTETILHAVSRWGSDAAGHLRGMYALALLDRRARTLTLARDPLGIKPLYVHRRVRAGVAELVIASEPQAILAHPEISPAPDMQALSAYFTTIRPETGARTLFKGVESLRPGEWRVYDLSKPDLPCRVTHAGLWPAADGASVRDAVAESVRRHLRSDRPLCALLSGGLDSSILATLAARTRTDALHTYCAGAPSDAADDDFACARLVATTLGTRHAEVAVTGTIFRERWPEMVRRLGVPLSTPNEVAIHEVARALRAEGHAVALSGEGADELFAGYETPMADAAAHARGEGPWAGVGPGLFHVLSNQWVPLDAKAAVLADPASTEGDGLLREAYEAEFAGLGASGLDGHLRFHRRVNLANLLRRLDTATMLAGVEGRTPLADVAVAGLAEGLSMEEKYRAGPPAETKRCLRAAFAADLPASVVGRAKASFPLPFAGWVAGWVGEGGLRGCPLFSGAAVGAVESNPLGLWHLAWPMANAALWWRRWWG